MGNRLDQNGDSLNDDLLIQYFVMYCRLTLLLQDQAKEDFDGLSALGSVMEWAEETVLPHINLVGVDEEGKGQRKRSVSSSATKHDLCGQVLRSFLQVCSNCLLVGLGTSEFVLKLSNFCRNALNADEKFLLLSDITSCLYHVTEFVVSLEEEDSEQSSVVVDLLTDVLMSAQRKSQQTTDTDKVIGATIRGPVTETLTTVYNRGGQQTLKQSLTASIITTVMDEMTQASVKDILEGVTESLDSLPPVSSLLTGVISKKPKMLRNFLEELEYRIKSCPAPDLHCLHGCIHLVTTFAKCKSSSLGLHECLVAVETHFKILDPPDDEERRYVYDNITQKLEECQKILN